MGNTKFVDISGATSGRNRRLPKIMRPKLQKQSEMKLAGRIIPRSRGQRDLPRMTVLSSPGWNLGI